MLNWINRVFWLDNVDSSLVYLDLEDRDDFVGQTVPFFMYQGLWELLTFSKRILSEGSCTVSDES